MNAAEAQAVLKEVDPQWRLLKPQEKVAGLTPRKTKGRNHNASQHVRESAR
jgi:hypothetical protein